MEISFQNKKALVTGAGKGIGRAIAVALHKGGAKVYAVTRTAQDLIELEKECPGIVPVCCDIEDVKSTRDKIDKIEVVDFLVNNAGVNEKKDFLDYTMEEFDWITSVNLRGPFLMTQLIARKMIAQGKSGSIVNISSIAAHTSFPEHAVYGPSKAALNSLTRNLAVEFGKYNIRVNAISPQIVMTALGKRDWSDPKAAAPKLAHVPLGRFAEIEEVVWPVLFLLSEKASMVTGAVLPVDGGFTVM